MASLYTDEDFIRFVADRLQALGHDVLSALDDGRANQKVPDDQVLLRAIELERVVLTFNRQHFRRLHLATPNHFGIVICRHDPRHEMTIADRIHAVSSDPTAMIGKLIMINRPSQANR